MRRRVVTGLQRLERMGALGAAPANCGISTASGIDQVTLTGAIQQCVAAGVSAAGAAAEAKLASAWGSFLADAGVVLAGGASGAATAIVDATAWNQVIAFVMAQAFSTVPVEPIVGDLCFDLVTFLADDCGIIITDLSVSTSSAGLIGFIIGVLVAAVTILADVLNPHSVETTYGVTVGGSDYLQKNIANAAAFLASPPVPPGQTRGSLAGMTAIWLAKKFNLFLANPTWLWANQATIGMCQPAPPQDIHQYPWDQVAVIFLQAPGAFELLSAAQFIEASAVVASSAAQLPFFMGLTPSGDSNANGYGVTVTPSANPFAYSVFLSPTSDWMPDPFGAAYGPSTTAIAQAINYVPPFFKGATSSNGQAVSGDCCGSGNTQPCPAAVNAPVTDASGNVITEEYSYAACPNLASNDNTTDASGNPTGQTDIGRGIFMLQVLYPALTANQCLTIFAANRAAYLQAVAANGSVPILASLNPGVAAPASTAAKLGKGLAAAAALAAIGLGGYALYTGAPVARVAETLYGDTKRLAAKPVAALKRKFR